MRLGIHVTKFDHPDGNTGLGPELAAVGAAAEAAGASWLSVMDHYFQMEHAGNASDAMLEGYTTLGYLAAHTSTVRLGVLVTGVTYRRPGLLAKIVTTLDVLSGGRAALGIGAAWYEREHRALGVPYPPTTERFELLEETIQICLQMWDPANNGPYEGRHFQLAETICSPPPVSQPHPPIVIGGGGERKTLRLVAQYGDATNLFMSSLDDISHKLDVLRSHCEELGRDYGRIQKTGLYMGSALATGDFDVFADEMRQYAKLGLETVIVMPPDSSPAAWIESRCTPAAARIAEL